MPTQIDTLVLGPLETNCYVLSCDRRCWVVDVGIDPAPLLRFLGEQSLTPQRILLTHGHGDHIAGVTELKEAFPDALLSCPADDAFMLSDPVANLSAPFGFPLTAPAPDELIEAGQVLSMEDETWKVLDTSGHTPGGVSFYCEQQKAVITGDSLFAGSVGRTDIPGANLDKLIGNIRTQLLALPDDTRILPGHGTPSTIGQERRSNPFLI